MLSINEAKEVVKSYTGLSIHGSSIRLGFTNQGKRCFETLKNVSLTKTNIKAANNKRVAICHDIEVGKFDYVTAFPNSKTALELIKNDSSNDIIPFGIYLDKYISDAEMNNRPKTYQTKKSRTDIYVRPFFGNCCTKSIKVSDIKDWINNHLSHLKNKTICEVLSPLRAGFQLAIDDEVITRNPMSAVKNPKKELVDNADPFEQLEIIKLITKSTERSIERDALIFAIYTGVRPSELLSLSLCDVDYEKRKLHINRSVVRGVFASTKNHKSDRCIDLLDEPYDILVKLKTEIEEKEFIKVKVLQDNNRLFDDEELQFIFTSSKSKRYWNDSETFNKMFVKPHCEAAGVRYRGIGQARHTYGSQLVTAGINLSWIAKQMGHSSIKMLEKHYGRFMESERPDMARQVSQKLKDINIDKDR
jgi:integrase